MCPFLRYSMRLKHINDAQWIRLYVKYRVSKVEIWKWSLILLLSAVGIGSGNELTHEYSYSSPYFFVFSFFAKNHFHILALDTSCNVKRSYFSRTTFDNVIKYSSEKHVIHYIFTKLCIPIHAILRDKCN